MSFRASHLKSILDNLGQEEYTRIVNAAKYNDQTQLGQLVSEMDPRDFDFAIHFVNKIKDRFNNNVGIYKQFLDILSTYRRDKRTIIQIYNKVKDLFASQPDLFDEFQKFLPDPTMNAISPQEEPGLQQQSTTFVSPEEVSFFDKVQSHLASPQAYNEFLKVVNLYNKDIINKTILVERVAYFLQKSPELFTWFRTWINFQPSTNVRHIVNQFHTNGITLEQPFTSVALKEHFNKELLGLGRKDVQTWQSSGSYRLMPESERKSPSSGRDPLANSVLNDTWVSHPTWASEDESFSVHRKNIYEETLHRTEDEKFELDMKILTNQVAIQILKQLSNDLQQMSPEEVQSYVIHSKDISTTLYRKAIRVVYDDLRGEEMINAFLKKPAIAIPIILVKLINRNETWLKDRREHDRVWREIFKSNFWKALDVQGAELKANLDNKKGYAPHDLMHSTIRNGDTLVFEDSKVLESVVEIIKIFGAKDQHMLLVMDDLIVPVLTGTTELLYIPACFVVVLKLVHLLICRFIKLKRLQVTLNIDNTVAKQLHYPRDPNAASEIKGDRFEIGLKGLMAYLNNDVDLGELEEQSIACYGLEAYNLFAVPKILQTIRKTMNEFNKTSPFYSDEQTELYNTKIEVDRDPILTIKVTVVVDAPEKEELEMKQDWQSYVDTFIHQPVQEDEMDEDNAVEDREAQFILKNGQKYKIKMNSSVLEKIEGGEDVFVRIKDINEEIGDLEGFEAKINELLQEAGEKYNIAKEELYYEIEQEQEEEDTEDNTEMQEAELD